MACKQCSSLPSPQTPKAKPRAAVSIRVLRHCCSIVQSRVRKSREGRAMKHKSSLWDWGCYVPYSCSDTGRAVQLQPAPPAQAQWDLVLGLVRMQRILCRKIFRMADFRESLPWKIIINLKKTQQIVKEKWSFCCFALIPLPEWLSVLPHLPGHCLNFFFLWTTFSS